MWQKALEAIGILESSMGLIPPTSFVPGLDKKLYLMLLELYRPFLDASYLDKGVDQYLIRDGSQRLIGVLSHHGSDFLQVALLPNERGHGLGAGAMVSFAQRRGLGRVNLAVHRDNQPSLELIDAIGAGLTERISKTRWKGYWRSGEDVLESERKLLRRAIRESGPGYAAWQGRFEERKDLELQVTAYAEGR